MEGLEDKAASVNEDVERAPAPAGRGLCLDCGYPLRGLRDLRCPICFRPFDPKNPLTMDMRRYDGVFSALRKPPAPMAWPILLVLTLGPVWLAFHTLGILTWLFFPLLGALLCVRRWRVAIGFVLLSPAAVFFAIGSIDYLRGRAQLWGTGLPSIEFFNIDRETRAPRRTSGCMIEGNEWTHHAPYNAAVRALTLAFGPQRRSYTGPYPTPQQAMRALQRDGEELVTEKILADQVVINGGSHALDKGVGQALLEGTDYYRCYRAHRPEHPMKSELARFGPVGAVVIGGQCLVIRVPAAQAPEAEPAATAPATLPATLPATTPTTRPLFVPDQPARIILIDAASGRPFAWYDNRQPPRTPPVSWWK